jgi:hypothetical protein
MTSNSRRLEPAPGRDYCSKAGAEQLAADIRRLWSGFGHDIRVWIEPGRGGREPMWIVKSARAGLPPPDSIRSAAP